MGLALLGQLLRLADHLPPRRGRCGHQIRAVPEQLGVGVERGRDQLAVPGRGVERPGQGVAFHRRLGRPGPRDDPPGLGELGLPRDVEAHDVHARVLRGQPAHQLLALLVRRARQLDVVDLVLAVGLLGAVVGPRLRGARRIRLVVVVQGDGASAERGATATRRQGQPTEDEEGAGPGSLATATASGRPLIVIPTTAATGHGHPPV